MHDWLKLKEDEIILEEVTTSSSLSTSSSSSIIITKTRNKSNKFYVYLKKLREKLSKNRLKRIKRKNEDYLKLMKKTNFQNFCKNFQNSLVFPSSSVSTKTSVIKNHLVKPKFKEINEKKDEIETKEEEEEETKNLFLKKNYPNRLFIKNSTPQSFSTSNNSNNVIFWCKICKYSNFGSSSSFFYNSINNSFCLPSTTNFTINKRSGKHKLVENKNKPNNKLQKISNEPTNNKKREKILCDYKKVLCSK